MPGTFGNIVHWATAHSIRTLFAILNSQVEPSEYLVAIPKRAVSHIQKIAPGPPKVIAVATPTILPIPTVAAKAVISVEN